MKKTLLIVENDKILRDMYAIKFKNAGYKVVAKLDAKTSLEWLSKNTVDVIILDIILPKVNGIKLIKSIRRDHKHKPVKIVILTHLNHTDINLNTTIRDSLGVDGYFVKSQIAPDKLIETVKTITG